MEKLTIEEARELAKSIALQISNQSLSEYAGARKIWTEIIDNIEGNCPDYLWAFKSNASAIEDIIWNADQGGAKNEPLIRECEQEIRKAAKELINL